MGNDGGSIPTRRELVKSAARAPNMSELKATALESLAHAWAHCALTSEPLDMENVASDWRGRLYNYEAVLRGLVPDAATSTEAFEAAFAATGIRSLRDVVRLRFKRYTPAAGDKSKEAVWACPVSLKEMGPATRAVYLVPCGHAFAEVAFKEVQDLVCPECGEAFDEENKIPILPSDAADVKRLVARMERLRDAGLTHALKKDKSGKKRKAEDADGDKSKREKREKKEKKSNGEKAGSINNALAASLTAKVLAEQDENAKRRRIESARA